MIPLFRNAQENFILRGLCDIEHSRGRSDAVGLPRVVPTSQNRQERSSLLNQGLPSNHCSRMSHLSPTRQGTTLNLATLLTSKNSR